MSARVESLALINKFLKCLILLSYVSILIQGRGIHSFTSAMAMGRNAYSTSGGE